MAEQTASGRSGASPGTPQTAMGSTRTASSSLMGRVREQATNQLNARKNKATEELGTVANAVRSTSQKLRDERHDTAARFVEQAANQLDRFSNQLRQREVGELMRNAQRFAQRRPAVFVGSAFAVGLLTARFMKSSAEGRGARDAEYRVESPEPGRGGMQGSQSTSGSRTRGSTTSQRTDYPSTGGT